MKTLDAGAKCYAVRRYVNISRIKVAQIPAMSITSVEKIGLWNYFSFSVLKLVLRF
jgi:hypothetical protein